MPLRTPVPRRRSSAAAVAPRASTQPYTLDASLSPALRGLLLGLFLLLMVLTVVLVRWGFAGLPVRTGVAAAMLGLLVLLAPHSLLTAAADLRRVIAFVTAAGVIAFVVTVLNGDGVALGSRQALEVHVQAVLTLVMVGGLVRTCGVRPVAYVFIGVVAVTSAVAVLQAIGLEAAWEPRRFAGDLMNDPPHNRLSYTRMDRPLGLSFSSIHLATQACLAFIVFYALRLRTKAPAQEIDHAIVAGLVALVFVCVMSGNRSPILGAAIFSALYVLIKAPKLFWVVAPVAAAVAPLLWIGLESLAQSGVRVAETDDGSAHGRVVLARLGVLLFLDQPMGYGMGFDSREHWYRFWDELKLMSNPDQVKSQTLHNYFLMVLNKHGIGLLLLLPLIIPRTLVGWSACLPGVIYLSHVAFHNDGPLQGDVYIWIVVAIMSVALQERARRFGAAASDPVGQPRGDLRRPGRRRPAAARSGAG